MAAWESIWTRGLMGENRNIPIGRVCTASFRYSVLLPRVFNWGLGLSGDS